MQLQIQITQIANGWMVATPPSQAQIQTMQQQNQQPQPVITYAADFIDVVKVLERNWPYSDQLAGVEFKDFSKKIISTNK